VERKPGTLVGRNKPSTSWVGGSVTLVWGRPKKRKENKGKQSEKEEKPPCIPTRGSLKDNKKSFLAPVTFAHSVPKGECGFPGVQLLKPRGVPHLGGGESWNRL